MSVPYSVLVRTHSLLNSIKTTMRDSPQFTAEQWIECIELASTLRYMVEKHDTRVEVTKEAA